MMILAILLIPLIAAGASYLAKNDRFSRVIAVIVGALNAGLAGLLAAFPEDLYLSETLVLTIDRDGLIILAVTDMLFLLTSLHLYFWQPRDAERTGGHFGMRYSSFTAILLVFFFTMTLTALAQDFGMLWVAVEATTLASAPLISYHRGKGSLEAMWKYLLICSIGIGVALFGTMLLAASLNDPHSGLGFDTVRWLAARNSSVIWFKLGFVLCFAGYALKMGLAPFHTWLPDAHSEAPAPVSALLSGSLLNCALLAVIRLWNTVPAELQGFCAGYLKFFGFFSLAAAAFFIIRQKDFKRLLAYSSVEHMGLITLFIAYGLVNYGIVHIVVHSLTKMALFLVAGNILLSYRTRTISQVRGLFSKLPVNGTLWIFGMLLICGTPPSPLFLTEVMLVSSIGLWGGMAVLALLLVIFCGMSGCMLQMTAPAETKMEKDAEVEKLTAAPTIAMTLVTLLGIVMTAALIIAEGF